MITLKHVANRLQIAGQKGNNGMQEMGEKERRYRGSIGDEGRKS
jgi:hypothetical protein